MKARFSNLTRFVAPVVLITGSLYLTVNTAVAQDAATGKQDGPKMLLMSGALKKTGTLVYLAGPTTIHNRVDSNAILNLDARPMDAPAAVTAIPATPAPAVVAQPSVVELRAKLKDANVRYRAAKTNLKAAAKSQDKTRVVAAKQNVTAIQTEIKGLNKQIAAMEPAPAVKKSRKIVAKTAVVQ